MVMTRSKRAKRVLRCLSISQHQDELLSPSTTPLIRYNLLHNYHRCRQVSIDLVEPADPVPNTVSYHDLPKFLRSQLEAQKITDGSRLWSQIVPILTFIQANLRRFGNSRGFPTLFFWYSREKHRSYFFFAFVENKMPSKTYTARELLRMRHAPVGKQLYSQLQERLRNDLELSEISRMPLERSLPLIEEEPLDMSGVSDESAPPNGRASRQLDGTDSEWKYRGRTDSEHAETQPISAPTELAAQRDEGFQRFYKAVVSPTHVRVTAGGRIVPNTRGSSSPTGRWLRERITAGDATSNSRPPSHAVPEQVNFPVPQAFGVYPPPMLPPFAPGMVHGMPHGPVPFPMMHWQMGLNLAAMAPHPLSQVPGAQAMPQSMTQAMPQAMPQATPQATPQNSSRSDQQSESGASENPAPVRVSPPEQFDPTRPFFVNGQWMMPPVLPFFPPFHMPPGFQAAPPPGFQAAPPPPPGFQVAPPPPGFQAAPPPPGFQAAPLPPGFQAAPPPGFPTAPVVGPAIPAHIFGMGTVMHPQAQRNGQAMQSQTPNVSSSASSSAPSPVAVSRPPISSIRLSEVTRKQLENLRGSLRYLQDQLQYNKHQIDEGKMEAFAEEVRQKIQHFEKNLGQQLAIEEIHYPNHETRERASDSTSSQNGMPSKSPAHGNIKLGHSNDSVSGSQDETPVVKTTRAKQAREQGSFRQANGSDLNKSFSALAISSPKKSSTLPVTAALAPPFQPRATGQKSKQATNETPTVSGSSSHDKSSEMRNGAGIASEPYLVGQLPPGIGPELVRDMDYVYPRELTEDELRARHMYWGKTPHHLQSGLPKFDGKDFYPPSPAGGRSTEAVSSGSILSNEGRAVGAVEVGGSGTTPSADLDPFQSFGQPRLGSSTRAGPLPQSERSVVNAASAPQHPTAASEGLKAESGDDSDENDEKNLLFKGRNSLRGKGTKAHNAIWQSMQRGMSSANAVPGTVSSMTAQGVLPHYTGHATASLTPAITNTSASPRVSAPRTGNSREAGSTSPVTERQAERQAENRPPGDAKSVRFGTMIFKKVSPKD